MTTKLHNIITEEIKQNGDMPIDRYMDLCLCHPEHGYYMKQDPFGKEGDFITAPEVSQIFGELVGAWLIANWQMLGEPVPFNVVELGAGRGTLMADIARTARLRANFLQGCLHIVEASPVLQKIQRQNLQDKFSSIKWHKNLDDLPSLPTVFVANEFFDALPIKQFVQGKERLIQYQNGELKFNIDAVAGRTIEVCEAYGYFVDKISYQIAKNTGVALIIDYGYTKYGNADSLQAMKSHEYCDALKDAGDADITAHVNFSELKRLFEANQRKVEIYTQQEFLLGLGINLRAKTLSKNKGAAEVQKIQGAVERLVSPNQMGTLFKVMVVS